MSVREDLLMMLLDGGKKEEYSTLEVTANGQYKAVDYEDVVAWDVVNVNITVGLKEEEIIDASTGEKETIITPDIPEKEGEKPPADTYRQYEVFSIEVGPAGAYLYWNHQFDLNSAGWSDSGNSMAYELDYGYRENAKLIKGEKSYETDENGVIWCRQQLTMTGTNSSGTETRTWSAIAVYPYKWNSNQSSMSGRQDVRWEAV